jgi:hypothetical protein
MGCGARELGGSVLAERLMLKAIYGECGRHRFHFSTWITRINCTDCSLRSVPIPGAARLLGPRVTKMGPSGSPASSKRLLDSPRLGTAPR